LAEDEKFMRLAIAEALKGIRRGGGPFGCAIVKNGKVIAKAHNTVVSTKNATAHSEIDAIRDAGKCLKTPFLDGCTLYSTTEPCPMCFSACHWARVKRVVYGSSISDAAAMGLNELRIPAATLKRIGYDRVALKGGVLRRECLKIFVEWRKASGEPY